MAADGTESVRLFGQAGNGFLTEDSEKGAEKDEYETDIGFRVLGL